MCTVCGCGAGEVKIEGGAHEHTHVHEDGTVHTHTHDHGHDHDHAHTHDDAPLGQELRLCAVQVRPRPVVLGVRSMRASKRSLVLQLVGLLLELGQGLIAVV